MVRPLIGIPLFPAACPVEGAFLGFARMTCTIIVSLVGVVMYRLQPPPHSRSSVTLLVDGDTWMTANGVLARCCLSVDDEVRSLDALLRGCLAAERALTVCVPLCAETN